MIAIGLVWLGLLAPTLGFQCLDNSGSPVDWYIIYKLPILKNGDSVNMKAGHAFYYMDTSSPVFTLSRTGIQEINNHAVYHTLLQIYKPQENGTYMYALYNDEPSTVGPSLNHGHTKGVVSFDKNQGFWLVHSTPKFPPIQSQGYSWPENGDVFGQSFLCVSYDISMMEAIGLQLQYTYPKIYDGTFPKAFESLSPSMMKVMSGRQSQVSTPPWNHVAKLTSKAGTSFQSFAKSKNFGADLYGSWLSGALQHSLMVETWQNGDKKERLPSNCTGKYKVINILELTFPDQNASFKESKDHSKWAVSITSDWTCIGGINRQKTQFKRGGGTVCLQNKAVWKNFYSLIVNSENCKRIIEII